jgi:hypothetical protein
LASTPTAPLVKLRSPFNGEVWTVPPDQPDTFIEALVARGFVRVEDEATKKRKEDR